MNIKLLVIFLVSFGTIHASDPYGFGNNPVTKFSWGGLALSGAKMAFNVISDHKTEIICGTVTNAVQYEQRKIEHDAEKAALIAENAELKKHVIVLREAVERNSKAMINAHEKLESCNKFINELYPAAEAVEKLGLPQLHMLAAFEQSENNKGFFTQKYNAKKNSFDSLKNNHV
jgi:hypothetical protein